MNENHELPKLTSEELRVLGCLVEKAKTTPENYPLTLNGLQAACNQKSSRKPVVSYDESTITLALDSLRKQGLVSTVVGGGSRTIKYKHNFAIQYPLLPEDLAVLCLLMLRGPLTPGEINNNAGRLYEFESIEKVQERLNYLLSELLFVQALPKKAGQKELRYMHLFGDQELTNGYDEVDGGGAEHNEDTVALTERVQLLEEKLAALQLAFDNLMKELT